MAAFSEGKLGSGCVISTFDGGMMISREDRVLRVGLVWRRMAGMDYGVYLASDPSPVAFAFRASYDADGNIESFIAGEMSPSSGLGWEEEHVDTGRQIPHMTEEEALFVATLADEMCEGWLQSFGSDEWQAVLAASGVSSGEKADSCLDDFLNSGLPFQMKKSVLPSFVPFATMTDGGLVYSTFSSGESEVESVDRKLSLFVELL